MEQSFEWEQMTYDYAPYFWARKNKWLELFPLDDIDPMFADFLRAGAARVILPVHPDYVRSVLAFFSNGCRVPDMGSNPPIANVPLYTDILAEVEELEGGELPQPELVGDPWEIRVPTNLVHLQTGPELNPPN